MNKTQRFLPGLAACIAGFVVFAGLSNTAFADPPPYHRISVGVSLLNFSFSSMVITISAEVGTDVNLGLGGSDLTLNGIGYVSGDIQITTAGEGTYRANLTMGFRDIYIDDPDKFQFNLPDLDVTLLSSEGSLGLIGPPGGFSLIGNEDDDWTFEGNDSTLEIDKLLRDYYNQGTGGLLIPLPSGFTGELGDLFSDDYWESSGGSFEGSAIPAPGAAVLGLLGLGMVGWVKRRKKEA